MSLIETWLAAGDFTGFVVAIYTSVLGDMFFGIVLFGVTVPIYIRYQSIVPALAVAVVSTAFLEVIMPPEMMDLARMLVILGVATLLYLVFTGGDRG